MALQKDFERQLKRRTTMVHVHLFKWQFAAQAGLLSFPSLLFSFPLQPTTFSLSPSPRSWAAPLFPAELGTGWGHWQLVPLCVVWRCSFDFNSFILAVKCALPHPWMWRVPFGRFPSGHTAAFVMYFHHLGSNVLFHHPLSSLQSSSHLRFQSWGKCTQSVPYQFFLRMCLVI